MTRFLILSRHDFRTRRKANMHFLAAECAKLGPTRFFSFPFSLLSVLKKDPRTPLSERANQVETVDAVDCYLWRTPLHPVEGPAALDFLTSGLFRLYQRQAPAALLGWLRDTDIVLMESGGPELLHELIRRTNPAARVVYVVSDLLPTVGTPRFVQRELERHYADYDTICVTSPRMIDAFPKASPDRIRHVPHGLELANVEEEASPFGNGTHLVSVGDMLFDPRFFVIAAAAFPNYHFHVIGGGKRSHTLSAPNIRVYPEMPFSEAQRYLRHASIGLAPYRIEEVPPYLRDTSMKLMQYKAMGLPGVCPEAAADPQYGIFGYERLTQDSITSAICQAKKFSTSIQYPVTSWASTLAKLLNSSQHTV